MSDNYLYSCSRDVEAKEIIGLVKRPVSLPSSRTPRGREGPVREDALVESAQAEDVKIS